MSKRTEIPSIDDPRIFIDIGPIPTKEGTPLNLRVPRFDFLEPDTHDALMSDVEALDVEAELIGAANDLAETPVGTPLLWQALQKETRKQLASVGVKIKRIFENNVRQDELTVPTAEVLSALEPWSSQDVVPLHKRMRFVRLAMLKHVVTPEQLEVCGTLASGQLNEIWDQWQTQSNIALGEFLASDSS